MAQGAPIEALVAVIKDSESSPDHLSGPDTYINGGPLTHQEGVRSVFGGSLMGQSATAAAATVPPPFQIYSCQATFLRPVRGGEKVHYRVERTSDGRAFASRIVRGTTAAKAQGANTNDTVDTCAFIATVCFQRYDLPAGNVLDYHVRMPTETGGTRPDDISAEKVQQMIRDGITRSVPLLQLGAKEEPFDWRPFDHPPASSDPTKFHQRSFVRSPALASDDPHVHQAALAFVSDTYTMGAALSANPRQVGHKLCNVVMGATLTNNVSIHAPLARVDRWMFAERDTAWGADGRVVVHQRFWDVDSGRLVMSGTQETLVRLKDEIKL